MKRRETTTPQYKTLRPGDGTVKQFVEDGHTLFAVRSAAPYGELHVNGSEHHTGLLDVAEVGSDYTVFIVPEESIALRALTLGTGNRDIGLLDDTYRDVGRTVTKIYTEGVMAPELNIDDFAINRVTGEVFLIPPIDFVKGLAEQDTSHGHSTLSESLQSLRGSLPAVTVTHLQEVLQEGIEYES